MHCFRSLIALVLGAVFCVSVDAAAKSGHILDLLDEQKVELKLSAKGAYTLNARLTNLTSEPLTVEFPPGLVADAFAQNQVLPQFSGGQGLSMLDSGESSVSPGQTAVLSFRTACMNFGIPEPTPRTPLFLKSVEDYSPNPVVHAVVTAIAANKVDTASAQAAIWHATNGLSWQQLRKLKIPGHGNVSYENVSEAQSLFASATSPGSEQDLKAVAVKDSPRLSIALNPDPRGSAGTWPLTRQLVRRLQATQPRFDVSFRNYVPGSDSRIEAQWSILLHAHPGPIEKRPLRVTVLESVLANNAAGRRLWRHGKPYQERFPQTGQRSIEELADELMTVLAQRVAHVRWDRGGQRTRLVVVNHLPVALTSLKLQDQRNADATVELSSIAVPAGSKSVVTLTESQADAMNKVRRFKVTGFDVGT